MTFGLRCSGPACRPHPASLPVRVPTVESLPPASFSFASRLHLAVRLRLPSSAPVGSFHPTRFCPCWAHPVAGLPAGALDSPIIPRPRPKPSGMSQVPALLRRRHNMNPPVLLPAPLIVLAAHRMFLAVADHVQLRRRDPHLHQIISRRFRPP